MNGHELLRGRCALVTGAGSGIGWFGAIVVIAAIREKMQKTKLPKGLAGAPLTLIITGLMSIATVHAEGLLVDDG